MTAWLQNCFLLVRRPLRTDSLSSVQRYNASSPFSIVLLEWAIPSSSFVLGHSQALSSALSRASPLWLSPASGVIITLNRLSHSFFFF